MTTSNDQPIGNEENDITTILLKRVYEKPTIEDGKRILVERLWPRDLRKEAAKMDEWLKEVAPSPELRKWYSHDSAKWVEFKKRYWKELDTERDVVENLAKETREGKVTFCLAPRKKSSTAQQH